jgi:ribosomal protein S14
MMLKNNILKINKDFIKKKNFIKQEIKKMILKSIIQNKNLKPIIRSLALYKLSRINLKASISKQNNNICLLSGRIGGVLKNTNLSRHSMKKLSINGNLQNIKITTW